MRTQKELLNEMVCNTHTLWAESFVNEVNAAFGTALKCHVYEADGGPRNPKGLFLDEGTQAKGLACFTLAPALCSALGVSYESSMGRGFQVRKCVDALRAAGYGQ